LNRLVERQLPTDRIKARPKRSRERFIHYYGRAGGEVGLGELASRTDWDAHRAEIARGHGHEPHARIAQRVRRAPRNLDGRRQSTGREGREIREGDTRHTGESARRILDLDV